MTPLAGIHTPECPPNPVPGLVNVVGIPNNVLSQSSEIPQK